MPNQENNTGLSIEERLSGDVEKAELKAILAEIDEQTAIVKNTLDRGLPPEKFQSMSKYKAALEVARDVTEKSWNFLSVR